MIQITPQLRILVAIEPIDARKGIDSLAQTLVPLSSGTGNPSVRNKRLRFVRTVGGIQ